MADAQQREVFVFRGKHEVSEQLVILTGASGAGKTTLAKAVSLRQRRRSDVFFFDSVGVPSTEDMAARYGSPEEWQRSMTLQWIGKLSRLTNRRSILLEGQMRIAFIQQAALDLGVCPSIILLDCSDEIRVNRLMACRQQPELANERMISWAQHLRKEAAEGGYPILDTGVMPADESVRYICEALNGTSALKKRRL